MERKGFVLPSIVGVCVLLSTLVLGGCLSRNDMFDEVSTPEIGLRQDTQTIPNNSGSCGFGTVKVRNSKLLTFTIENRGSAVLAVTGIGISAGDVDQFRLGIAEMGSVVKGGSETAFTLAFEPTKIGALTATVRIETNDPDAPNFTFTVAGYGEPSSVAVTQGGALIPDGSGSYEFGPVTAGYSGPSTAFTVENLGTGDFTILEIDLLSGDTNDFTIWHPPLPRTLTPGATEGFTAALAPRPGALGVRSAVVRVETDSQGENEYLFTLRGESLLPVPDIAVEIEGAEYPSGSAYDGFGTVTLGSAGSPVTFTIRNSGTAELALTTINSSDLQQFEPSEVGVDWNLEPGESTAFTVTFMPSGAGVRTATIEILSNDAGENPYTLAVSGVGTPVPVPEINLRRGSTGIPSGALGYDFGAVILGYTSSSVTFTIENRGTATLTVSGITTSSPAFTLGAPAAPFTIAPGGSRTFTASFSPSAVGTLTGTVSIGNDDADENPYTFTVTGTGQPTAPVMSVRRGVTVIPDGSTSAYNFGTVEAGTTSPEVVFTIDNTAGTDTLLINDVFSGSGEFVIGFSGFSNSVPKGGTTTFTLCFAPSGSGAKSAVITIMNNDPAPNKNPYTFTVTGAGKLSADVDISLSAEGTPLPVGSTCSFGSVGVGSSLAKVFTILNDGPEDLVISNIVKTTGTSLDFLLDISGTLMNQPIPAGGTTAFVVTFSPASSGTAWRDLEINSTANQSPYTIRLEGNGQ